MINIKDKIYKALSDKLNNVSDVYPQDWASLPAIQYTEEDNKVHEWCDDKEASSYVRYRIDIWNDGSTSSTALEVDEVMAKFGLKRIQCTDVTDFELRHKQMRYEAIYDVDQEFIYHS